MSGEFPLARAQLSKSVVLNSPVHYVFITPFHSGLEASNTAGEADMFLLQRGMNDDQNAS